MITPDAIRSRAIDELYARGQLHLDTLAAAIDCGACDLLPVLNRHDSFRRVAGARGWEFDLTSDYRISMEWAKAREGKKANQCNHRKTTQPAEPPSGSASGEARSPAAPATNTSPTSKPARALSPKPAAAVVQPEPLPSVSAPTLSIETIDPDRARRMLARSTGNRSTRRSHVAWLAEQMRRGSFRLSHQAIAFSTSGRLLDGHHRLAAIVASGQAQSLAVSYGWADETWDVIDCGVVRVASDRLVLHADSHRNRRAIRLITAYLRCEVRQRGKVFNEDILTTWPQMRGGIDLVERMFPSHVARLTRTQVLAAIARYYQLAPDLAPSFAEALRTGAASAGNPAVVLRGFLLERFYLAEAQTYWLTVAAARAHRTGAELPPGDVAICDSWDAA